MMLLATRTLLAGLTLGLMSGLAAERSHAHGEDGSRIRAALHRVDDSGARGIARFFLVGDFAKLELHMRGLARESEYALVFDGVERAHFTTRSSGSARLKLNTDGMLDFDPRTGVFEIVGASGPVLSGDLYAVSRFHSVRELTTLTALDASEPGEVRVSYTEQKHRRRLRVWAKGLVPGDYGVIVDGEEHGVLRVDDSGSGHYHADCKSRMRARVFKHHRHGQCTSSGLLGAEIEIVADGAAIFSGLVMAPFPADALPEPAPEPEPTPDPICTPALTSLRMNPMNPIPGASMLELLEAEDCSRRLTWTLLGVPPGDYQLHANGAAVATVTVTGSETIAMLATNPAPGESPLTFDAHGAAFEVHSGGVMLYGLTFP